MLARLLNTLAKFGKAAQVLVGQVLHLSRSHHEKLLKVLNRFLVRLSPVDQHSSEESFLRICDSLVPSFIKSRNASEQLGKIEVGKNHADYIEGECLSRLFYH